VLVKKNPYNNHMQLTIFLSPFLNAQKGHQPLRDKIAADAGVMCRRNQKKMNNFEYIPPKNAPVTTEELQKDIRRVAKKIKHEHSYPKTLFRTWEV